MTHIDVEHWLGIAGLAITPAFILAAVIYYAARIALAIPAWIKRNEL